MTNEELYLLQRWERTGFRSNRIGSFSNLLRERTLPAWTI